MPLSLQLKVRLFPSLYPRAGHELTSKIAGILVATYSVCQKICLYRVQISWNPPQWDTTQGKQAQFPIPSFAFLHCKIDMPSSILDVNQGADEHTDPLPFQNSVYSLNWLEIMPGQIDSPTGSTANPWILAVFAKPLHSAPEYPDQQGPSSVIVRWQLENVPQAFHPKFDEVAPKKNNAQAKVCTILMQFQVSTKSADMYQVQDGAASARRHPLR